MNDLIQFLRDRLDEDEAVAQRVGFDRIEAVDYLWGTNHLILQREDEGESKVTAELDADLAKHIARHDPARVLRRVAADRRNVAEYERYLIERRRAMNGWDSGEVSPVMAALAAVYADHPDYDEEWRP